jgi:excisionase family DNA binding protein
MDKEAAPEVRLLTVPQVAVMLNFSEATIWKLIASGEIRSVKEGWSRRITPAAVDVYVKSLEAASGQPVGGAA